MTRKKCRMRKVKYQEREEQLLLLEEIFPNIETLDTRIEARIKQLVYGMSTDGYINFCTVYQLCERKQVYPLCPNIFEKRSKRTWNSIFSKWRRELHKYDQIHDWFSLFREIEFPDIEENTEYYSSFLGGSLSPVKALLTPE
jgi:hypothetical protein